MRSVRVRNTACSSPGINITCSNWIRMEGWERERDSLEIIISLYVHHFLTIFKLMCSKLLARASAPVSECVCACACACVCVCVYVYVCVCVFVCTATYVFILLHLHNLVGSVDESKAWTVFLCAMLMVMYCSITISPPRVLMYRRLYKCC